MQAVPFILMAAGGATQAYGTYQQGKYANAEARENARLEEINTAMEAGKARRDYERLQGVTRRTLGSLTAATANNGVSLSSGSSEDIYRDSAVQLELDARNAQYEQAQISAVGASRATSLRKAGSNAKKSATLGAVGGLLTTAGSMMSMGGGAKSSVKNSNVYKAAPAYNRGGSSATLMSLSGN